MCWTELGPTGGLFAETTVVPMILKQKNHTLFLPSVTTSESTGRICLAFHVHVPTRAHAEANISHAHKHRCVPRAKGMGTSGPEWRLPMPAPGGPLEWKKLGIYKLCDLEQTLQSSIKGG